MRLWDPRVQTPVVALEPESGSEESKTGGLGGVRDCWAVAFGNSFSDDERVISAGFVFVFFFFFR